jgi:hypothetical protein
MSYKAQQVRQLGPAVVSVGTFLAFSCFFFGTWFAVYASGSFEQQIEIFFFLGLMPAAGFYAVGHLLSGLLVLGSALCEKILVQCFRCVVLILSGLLSWISAPASDVSSIRCVIAAGRFALLRLHAVNQKTYRSFRRSCLDTYVVFIGFCCLLIRSAARFLIGMQATIRLDAPVGVVTLEGVDRADHRH